MVPPRLRLRARLHALGRRLRTTDFRNDDLALILVAALLGVLAGLAVSLMRLAVDALHFFAFAIPFGTTLSDASNVEWQRAALVLVGGGALVGLTALAIRRLRPRETIDAIEANALYGGRMSLLDSLGLALLSILSAGSGASVGLEAAYTQVGAGLASKLGRSLNLRRHDLRTLVGCGAAAAIAAAFNAPLAGAFYAFELIVGSYTLGILAPVAAAALTGALTVRILSGNELIFTISRAISVGSWDYALFLLLGLAAAGVGILTMQGVTQVEHLLRRLRVPSWLRPVLGGAVVAVIAFACPQILGSGHGAILYNLTAGYELPMLATLILAKIAASALSVGSGFRGGLFSSSLLLGSLFGSAVAAVLGSLPWITIDPVSFTLVGMGAVAAAIVGAPITMVLLVLEMTGDFAITMGVMVGVLAASVTVRQLFGYSFATWRFHQRGLRIRSAEDVGWIDDLRVANLMRADAVSISATVRLDELRAKFPVGSVKRLFLVDDQGRYAGLLDALEAHGVELDSRITELTARDLMRQEGQCLYPAMNIRDALRRFIETRTEVLPVVDGPETRRVLGYVTEGFALKRYNQELERIRGEAAGESLFSPT